MQMQHTNVLTLDNCTVLVKPVRDEGVGIVTNKSFERAISRERNGAQFKGQFTQKKSSILLHRLQDWPKCLKIYTISDYGKC